MRLTSSLNLAEEKHLWEPVNWHPNNMANPTKSTGDVDSNALDSSPQENPNTVHLVHPIEVEYTLGRSDRERFQLSNLAPIKDPTLWPVQEDRDTQRAL